MKTLYTLCSALLGLSLSVNALAGTDYPTAIRTSDLGWEFASISGQTVRLLDMYTENAIVIPPTSEILSDPSAIEGYWAEVMASGVSEYVIDTVNLHVEGDVAHQTALWQASIMTEDGNVIHFDGAMTNVLERQDDGLWKIRMQSWN
jgi:ketosteroid isomerase-like protein